jgi:PAS domain S-box-containing protein
MDYATAQQEITKILGQAEDLTVALRKILALVGTTLRWEYAGFWRFDHEAVNFRCIETWTETPETCPQFVAISRLRPIALGTGLPGHAVETRNVVWFEKLHGSARFPRRDVAEREGLQTGVCAPILRANLPLGAIEAVTAQALRPDAQIKAFLAAVARQIAIYLDRQRLTALLTGNDREFAVVAQQTPDAVVTIDETSKILFVNRAAERLFGYSPGQLEGLPLQILIPPELRRAHEHGMQAFLRTGQRRIPWDGVILTALDKTGRPIRVDIRFGEMVRGGKRLFAGFISQLDDE